MKIELPPPPQPSRLKIYPADPDPGVYMAGYSFEQMLAFRAEGIRIALEAAATECAALVDMNEEARSEKASCEARGTKDELDRLRHWMTVSTFNSGIRRCVSAVRALMEDKP